MDILGTLKQKVYGIPVWVIAVVLTGLLAVWMRRRKSTSTKTAADQTNSDLGTAANLANFFTTAGLMPYQGGDTYVNQTVTNNPTGGGPVNPPPREQGGHPPIQGGHPPIRMPGGGSGPVQFPVYVGTVVHPGPGGGPGGPLRKAA